MSGLWVREPTAGSLKSRPSNELVILLGCTNHDKGKKVEELAYRQEFLLFFGALLQDRHGNVASPARGRALEEVVQPLSKLLGGEFYADSRKQKEGKISKEIQRRIRKG